MQSHSAALKPARLLAQRIVKTGEGRVRRVVVIGSHARGVAGTGSDLDVVVFVEPPADAPAWGLAECAAERERIKRVAGPPPVRTELWVRTLDHFAEAHAVVGSMEWLAETEGVELYRRAPDRAPAPRRSATAVRDEYMAGWLSHAHRALGAARSMEQAGALKPGAGPSDVLRAARAAVDRAVTSLMVLHGVWASKQDGTETMLARLEETESAVVAELRAHLDGRTVTPAVAQVVVGIVSRRLGSYLRTLSLPTPARPLLGALVAPPGHGPGATLTRRVGIPR